MTNHIEDFTYRMGRECKERDGCCLGCKYYYRYWDMKAKMKEGCFKDDLVRYISYQESLHG